MNLLPTIRASILSCFFVLFFQCIHAQSDAVTSQKPYAHLTDLFASDEPLELTYRVNMKKLLKDRGDNRHYHTGSVVYTDDKGEKIEVNAKSKVRGNFRRMKSNCSFPPIRLKFDSASVVGTVFQGQNKLKLVTPCQTKKEAYQQYILAEYLIYRSYNILTDSSFQVRLVHITYEDEAGKLDPLVRYAFFIEDEDAMAERIGGTILEIKNIHPNQTNLKLEALVSTFQYFVGNTDWSIPGLHNIKLVQTEMGAAPLAVPYDFDWCGAVDPPYAVPNPQLGIFSVKERLYRGFCRSEDEFNQTFALFKSHKDEIYDLYNSIDYLDVKFKKKCIQFYDEFYEMLEDPKKYKREILATCRN